MKSKGTITFGKYKGEPAVIAFENDQLIFFTKPYWKRTIRMIFGVIGEALVSEKERFRINVSDITCLFICEDWKGKPVFEITTPNGVCKIAFKRDDELTSVLKIMLKEKIY